MARNKKTAAWWNSLTPQQRSDYVAKKMAAKTLKQKDAPAPFVSRTKFPFAATINGRQAIVWPDWTEYPEP